MKKHLLVTGGAGFIGSAFVRTALKNNYKVDVLDALTYAGHLANLRDIQKDVRFIEGNICNFKLVSQLMKESSYSGIVHFAAESHVDNSISGPEIFIQTNILGTFTLLEATRSELTHLPENFRFVHISTDEVFGELGEVGKFTEETPYSPRSPYSASKAGSDHLAKAWFHTYKLPVLLTNCSNNYGPRQFPEKLIPRMVVNALNGKPLPVYGTGTNIRDWIHVDDHSKGILSALEKGTIGESYCFGGNSERTNLEVVKSICGVLDRLKPRTDGISYSELIRFVEDRKGHDYRYAIDFQKSARDLGYKPSFESFEKGLEATVAWYLENNAWIQEINQRPIKRS